MNLSYQVNKLTSDQRIIFTHWNTIIRFGRSWLKDLCFELYVSYQQQGNKKSNQWQVFLNHRVAAFCKVMVFLWPMTHMNLFQFIQLNIYLFKTFYNYMNIYECRHICIYFEILNVFASLESHLCWSDFSLMSKTPIIFNLPFYMSYQPISN